MLDDNYIEFIPGVKAPEQDTQDAVWFLFREGKLLVQKNEDKVTIPEGKSLDALRKHVKKEFYLGSLRGKHCFTTEIENIENEYSDMCFVDLRSIMNQVGEELFLLCGRAIQVINWDKDHRFCGRCGREMASKEDERAKVCLSCGNTNYPRISPAIIVAVTKGNRLLMAHNKNFKPGFYSVIAGFVDPGETFEQCVKREVMEEVGIKIKNIKYFKSQPWPFPNSLMVAFTAEYDSGEIAVDNVEIGHADWYSKDNMPSVPMKGSVARKLIDWFIDEQNK